MGLTIGWNYSNGGGESNIVYGTNAGSSPALAFSSSTGTVQTERARIDSSGNLLVGTTSVGGAGGLSILPNGSSGSAIGRFNRTSTTSTSYPLAFQNGGSDVGYVSYTNTTALFVSVSDYRLKENIEPMQNALSTVAKLKPCTYTWKSDNSTGQGFIAHELQEVIPDAVSRQKDETDVDGNPVYQGIDTSFVVATLTAAIQEQQALITQLQADVATLKASK